MLSFLLNFLDFEPGDHTLLLRVTALDGKSDDITVQFTTPPRLSVRCSVVNSVLRCDTTTEVSSQRCSFNDQPQISCPSPFNIRPLNLDQGDHSVSVAVTDVFGQTDTFAFDFSTIPSASITLTFEPTISLGEGTSSMVPFLFTIVGEALQDVPFTLRSLTYQQFQDMTGNTVSSIFPGIDIPPPASESKKLHSISHTSYHCCVFLQVILMQVTWNHSPFLPARRQSRPTTT